MWQILLLIVAFLGGILRSGEAALELAQDYDDLGIGKAGDVLIENIVPYHTSLGLQHTAPLWNETAVVMTDRVFEKVCRLLLDGNTDKVKELFNGARILFHSQDLSCASYEALGPEYAREYHKLWCTVSPFVVSVDESGWYPGIFANFRATKDDELMAWIHRTDTPCFWLASSGSAVLDRYIQMEEDLLWINIDFGIDRNEVDVLIHSSLVQLFFRVVIPILYMWNTVEALRGIRVRKQERKTPFSFMAILVTNTIQGLFLTVGSTIGLSFITDTFPFYIHVVSATNFFGLSVATDLVFAFILSNVSYGLRSMKMKQQDSYQVLALFVSLALLEAGSLLSIVMEQTPTSIFVASTVVPLVFTGIGVITAMNLVYQMRVLTKLLSSTHDINVQVPAIILLANKFVFWTWITILSVAFTYTALLMASTWFWTSNPIAFVLTVAISNIGKVLNMISQTKCCSLPGQHVSMGGSVMSKMVRRMSSRLQSSSEKSPPGSPNSPNPNIRRKSDSNIVIVGRDRIDHLRIHLPQADASAAQAYNQVMMNAILEGSSSTSGTRDDKTPSFKFSGTSKVVPSADPKSDYDSWRKSSTKIARRQSL